MYIQDDYTDEVINLAYIHFTDEQKQQAVSVDLEAFLRRRGERLISSGRDKRLASDRSITIRGGAVGAVKIYAQIYLQAPAE